MGNTKLKHKSSGQLTREWLRSLNYRVECVESLRYGGSKKDFLGFIDDIAWFDNYMIGIQSCFNTDLSAHKKKFEKLVMDNSPITNWMKCAELWLVWWTPVPHNNGWYPEISILNPHIEICPHRPKLELVK